MMIMMKRIAALLLVFLLCLSGTVRAETETAAEEESLFTVMNWEDYREYLYAYFDEVAVKIWMPIVFRPADLTEEDREKGLIAIYTDDPETMESGIRVTLAPAEYGELADYVEAVLEKTDTAELLLLNGIPALAYILPDEDAMRVGILCNEQSLLEFVFWPVSGEDLKTLYEVMMASIQATD